MGWEKAAKRLGRESSDMPGREIWTRPIISSNNGTWGSKRSNDSFSEHTSIPFPFTWVKVTFTSFIYSKKSEQTWNCKVYNKCSNLTEHNLPGPWSIICNTRVAGTLAVSPPFCFSRCASLEDNGIRRPWLTREASCVNGSSSLQAEAKRADGVSWLGESSKTCSATRLPSLVTLTALDNKLQRICENRVSSAQIRLGTSSAA